MRQVVEVAHGNAVHFQALSSKGTMPDEEARQRAAAAIQALRYSGNEYIWINDMHPRMVMHPIRPELNGQDLSGNKDPNGLALFVEFVRTVKAQGAGFVPYMWPKAGSDTPVEKTSYVKGFEPWGWVIGSGVYIDTVNAAIWQRALGFGVVALVRAPGSSAERLASKLWSPGSVTHRRSSFDFATDTPLPRSADSSWLVADCMPGDQTKPPGPGLP